MVMLVNTGKYENIINTRKANTVFTLNVLYIMITGNWKVITLWHCIPVQVCLPTLNKIELVYICLIVKRFIMW